MCIIIRRPANVKLEDELYEQCWWKNDDGLGFAYVCPVKKDLVVEKGFMTKQDAMEALKKIEGMDALIHFRKVSRGANSKENCHPFYFESSDQEYAWAVAHNGTLDIKPVEHKSDTATFVDLVLSPWLDRDPDLFESRNQRWIFEQWMTPRNKIVILRYERATGELKTYYLNKDVAQTNEKDGVWFSNWSWVSYKSPNYNGYNGTHCTDSDPEYSEDHLGWVWNNAMKKFTNDRLTPGVTQYKDKLEYRTAHQGKYTCEGKEYDRLDEGRKWRQNDNWGQPRGNFRGHCKIDQTNILQLTPGDVAEKHKPGDKEITVPRESDAYEVWDDHAKLMRAINLGTMHHLSKRDKKTLKEIAMSYAKMCGASGTFNEFQAVSFLRHEWISMNPAFKTAQLKDLDEAIIKDGGYGFIDKKRDEEKKDGVMQFGYGTEV